MEALVLFKPELKEKLMPQLLEWATNSNDGTIQVITAQLLYRDGDIINALKILTNKESLEWYYFYYFNSLAVQAQIYLSLNRVENAYNIYKIMQAKDDECALTQIVNCLYLFSVVLYIYLFRKVQN